MRLAARIRTGAFVLAVGICCLMIGQPVAGARVKGADKEIQGRERVLHALNRFTFGPRPGDVTAVEAMGLRKWFDRQLNPLSIDDSALDTRLAMFPAMKISQPELMERYPSPQRLRQMIRTGMPLPRDPVEHAIYADEIARYEVAKAKREAQTAGGAAKTPGEGVDMGTPAMALHEEQQPYSGVDARTVIHLPPEERMRRIVAMPPEEFLVFCKSLNQRQLAAVQEGLNPEQKELFAALQGGPRMIGAELLQSRMIRDIYSGR